MQKIPTIKINYSLEFEQIRVKDTFEKIDWFREHEYNPIFPGNKRIPDISETCELTDLIELVHSEYDQHFFIDITRKFEDQWKWFVDNWQESPINQTALVFEDSYEVFLTSYGVGGSYDLPNTVVMNVRQRAHHKLVVILFHEIIHLSIEPFIQKYSIPHWYKERIVDLFYKRIFPEKAFEQNLPKEVLVVDSIFNNNFSQPEEIIKELSKYLAETDSQN